MSERSPMRRRADNPTLEPFATAADLAQSTEHLEQARLLLNLCFAPSALGFDLL